MKKAQSVKFCVSFPEELYQEFKSIALELGIKSKSKALQKAASMFIALNRWYISKGKATGAVVIIYNHESRGLDEMLTDVQHDFMDVIISALHVHLSREECMLIIAVSGEVERIKSLYSSISRLKGIKHLHYSLSPFPVS